MIRKTYVIPSLNDFRIEEDDLFSFSVDAGENEEYWSDSLMMVYKTSTSRYRSATFSLNNGTEIIVRRQPDADILFKIEFSYDFEPTALYVVQDKNTAKKFVVYCSQEYVENAQSGRLRFQFLKSEGGQEKMKAFVTEEGLTEDYTVISEHTDVLPKLFTD